MTFFLLETFILGVKNLRLHKLRSLLTALGIIFGVAAVIVMVSIGEGTKQAAMEQIKQLGATNILLRSNEPPQSSDAQSSSSRQRILKYGLTRTDLTRLESIPGLKRSVNVLTVIGVLEPTGLRAGSEGASMMRLDPDQGVYFPYPLARAVFGDSIIRFQSGTFERKNIELTEIWLQAESTEQVEYLASVAENVIKIGHGEKIDYEVKAPIQILRNAEQTKRLFNFIMVGIASFALVVG